MIFMMYSFMLYLVWINIFLYFEIAPLPVTKLNAASTGSSIVQLSWADADGSYQDSYHWRYRVSNKATDWTNTEITVGYEISVNRLFPGTQYTFGMKAVSKDQKSTEETTTTVVCRSPDFSGFDSND